MRVLAVEQEVVERHRVALAVRLRPEREEAEVGIAIAFVTVPDAVHVVPSNEYSPE